MRADDWDYINLGPRQLRRLNSPNTGHDHCHLDTASDIESRLKPLSNLSWRWPIVSQRSEFRVSIPQANLLFEVKEVKRDEVESAKL